MKLSIPARHTGLNKQDIPAILRPCQPGRNTRHHRPLRHIGEKPLLPENLLDIGHAHALALDFLTGHLCCHVPAHRSDLTLQIPNPRLPRVLINHPLHRRVRHLKHLLRKTILFDLLWNQILLRNFQLLLQGVSTDINNLHPVPEWCWDRIQRIGRSDEHHFRQIIIQLQIVIHKRIILLRIQHFQQGRGGVPAKRRAHLVDFIEHHHRICLAGPFHRSQNPPGQCTDVGSPMAPNLRLIMNPAQ